MTTGNFNQVRHNWHMLAHGEGGWLVAAIMLTLLTATAFLLVQYFRSLRPNRRLRLFHRFSPVAGSRPRAADEWATTGHLRCERAPAGRF